MVGRTISHYRITEKLGEGGMGVVYKARDTHLDRFVAIKVLPPEKVANPERKRRFVQEAKSASALNHPNIVTVHDIDQQDGIDFMVMEYVAGKTLNELIPRKGMRLNEVLKYSVQIADALNKAHSAGIVHRDLKPGNIMVSEDGLVKVLDFGLAKLTEVTASTEFDETRTARLPSSGPHTEEGTVLGTVNYMSPEQAEGRKVDARSDIFSFGCVLYEMVTGRRAFEGDSKLSTLAAILNREPPPLGEGVPHDLEKVISRALRKDPARRFQHMDDFKVSLDELKQESDSGKLPDAALPRKPRRRKAAFAVVPVIVAMVAILYWAARNETGAPEAPLKVVPLTSEPGSEAQPSFSPDGSQVTYAHTDEGNQNWDIYTRVIGSSSVLRLTSHPAQDQAPAWSPDGRNIAFLRFLDRTRVAVKLIPALGGPERLVTELRTAELTPRYQLGVAWVPDGRWLITSHTDSAEESARLYRVSVDTGERYPLTEPPPNIAGDFDPALSADGRDMAFVRAVSRGVGQIFHMRLETDLSPAGEPKRLTQEASWNLSPVWSRDSRNLIWSSGPGLWEVKLWRIALARPRESSPLPFGGEASGDPAIPATGAALAYSKWFLRRDIYRLRVGEEQAESFLVSTRADRNPQYSADGRRVTFVSDRLGHSGIWVADADGSNATEVFFSEGAQSGSPAWSPDSSRIAFDSTVTGTRDIYVVGAQGGKAVRISHGLANDSSPAWSTDGRWIYFHSTRTGRFEVWKVVVEQAGAVGEPVQVTRNGGRIGRESPDGRFAYYLNGPDGKSSLWRMPAAGGEEEQILPLLVQRAFVVRREGIYFIAPDSSGEDSIRYLDLSTGQEKTLASAIGQASVGLSVSPDEQYVLFTLTKELSSDLMLAEGFQ